MNTPSVEASKAIRLQRLEARKRNRGGIFVPSTSNPLIDILLARDVSGASPGRQRKLHTNSPRKKNAATASRTKSVARKGGKTKSSLKVPHSDKLAERTTSKSTNHFEEGIDQSSNPQTDETKLPSKKKKPASGAGTDNVDNTKASKIISKKSKAKKSRSIVREEEHEEEPNDGLQEPGSSKLNEVRQRNSKKRLREVPEEEVDSVPDPPSKKRAKKGKTAVNASHDPIVPVVEKSSELKETSKKPRRKGRTKDPPLSKSLDQIQLLATTSIDAEALNKSHEQKKEISRFKAHVEEKPVLVESSRSRVLHRGYNDAKGSLNGKKSSHASLSTSKTEQEEKGKKKAARSSSKDKKENAAKTLYTHSLKGVPRSKQRTKISLGAFDAAMDSDTDPIDFLTKH